MKIIHTADIHLDSAFGNVANPTQRRLELLKALANLSEYANNNQIEAVIIAGDLFDDKFATAKTVRAVADIISASNCAWFVLRGNHGDATPYAKLAEICPQVKTFGDNWTGYTFKGVHICGRELGANDQLQWQNLQLPDNCYNILVLHGDIDEETYGVIDKKVIANSGANYVALGHRHSFSAHKFGKAVACYSGVLEARGFDEREPTGFILLDTEKNTVTFVKQAIRAVVTLEVDITGVQSEIALENLVGEKIATISPRNYLNLILKGKVNQLNLSFLAEFLQGKFFALRLDDQTQADVDIAKLAQEVSLRGEFVRRALKLPIEQQAEVLKMGLALLEGGDLQ